MKRLLISLLAALSLPTAVNAFPFGGDITEKTDIGEKYIVKKSTVYETKSWTKKLEIEKRIATLKARIEYNKESIGEEIYLNKFWRDQALKENRKRSAEMFQNSLDKYEARLKRRVDSLTEDISKEKQNLKELNEYMDRNQNNLIMFSFTPIYVDLNGNKIPEETMSVACVSPYLDTEKRKELADISGDYLVDSGDYDLSSKVCKQYAKFKK